MNSHNSFPSIITSHPTADISFDGVKSHLIQAGEQQFIFMEFEKDVVVPEHFHDAQWAVVLDGEIEITIGGVKNVFKKSDTYFVEKGVKHSAKIKKGYTDLTLFNQPVRYKVKN